RFVVPEFLQDEATMENLTQAAVNLYDDTVTRRRLEALFGRFAEALDVDTEAVAAEAVVAEIDALNILQASLLAMRRAVAGLSIVPTEALVDGDHCPDFGFPARAIVKGDRDVPSISAASILAKTTRDAMLVELDRLFPAYGFAQHKGYATREHLAALNRHGPCPAHRRFMPVVQPAFDFGD